jgi:hypothetical protein
VRGFRNNKGTGVREEEDQQDKAIVNTTTLHTSARCTRSPTYMFSVEESDKVSRKPHFAHLQLQRLLVIGLVQHLHSVLLQLYTEGRLHDQQTNAFTYIHAHSGASSFYGRTSTSHYTLTTHYTHHTHHIHHTTVSLPREASPNPVKVQFCMRTPFGSVVVGSRTGHWLRCASESAVKNTC